MDDVADEDHEVDTDEAITCLMHYALALEIMSQVYLQAASELAEEDQSHLILNSLKEDRDFINSYKKVMAKEPMRGYKTPPKKFRFYMKGADA